MTRSVRRTIPGPGDTSPVARPGSEQRLDVLAGELLALFAYRAWIVDSAYDNPELREALAKEEVELRKAFVAGQCDAR